MLTGPTPRPQRGRGELRAVGPRRDGAVNIREGAGCLVCGFAREWWTIPAGVAVRHLRSLTGRSPVGLCGPRLIGAREPPEPLPGALALPGWSCRRGWRPPRTLRFGPIDRRAPTRQYPRMSDPEPARVDASR